LSGSSGFVPKFKSVHVLGIGGTLMAPVSIFLKERSVNVTGTDGPIYPPMSTLLKNADIHPFLNYSASHLDKLSNSPDFVIVGNVVRADNPEVKEAKKRGWKLISLPEFMEENLLLHTKNIVVSGTHGKTTSSSMMAFVLREMRVDASYFIGGVSSVLPKSFHVSENFRGGYFVLEGDEYDTAFWDKVPKFYHYLPDQVILTSIEFDHADIYSNIGEIEDVFEVLVHKVPPTGRIVACSDYPIVGRLIKEAKCEVITYGENSTANFKVDHYIETEDGAHCRVACPDGSLLEMNLAVSGMHNTLNALSVLILALKLGFDQEQVLLALSRFTGVKRRLETRGVINDITVIEDFAHHPTAVKMTLESLKKKYRGRRLHAVFEPRSATSRRGIFQSEYSHALVVADRVLVAEPFDQTLIPEDQRFSTSQLVVDLKKHGCDASSFESVEGGVSELVNSASNGDVIVVMSNGGFGGFIEKLIDSLR